MSELKPCPFCGSTNCKPVSNGCNSLFIECMFCGASGPTYESDDETAESWNRRTQPAQVPRLSETEVKAEFAKLYPQDAALLSLAENNRDYAVEAIGARHHWAAFKRGAAATEAAGEDARRQDMTHLERLLGALYVSEVWWTSWMLKSSHIYYKARAMVVFDRVLCNDPSMGDKT